MKIKENIVIDNCTLTCLKTSISFYETEKKYKYI